jgi:hypothetical protein
MRIPSRKYVIAAATAGNLNAVAAGGNGAGATLQSQNVVPGTLSALFVVEAETDTVTIAAQWQGSDDGTTWYDMAGDPQNPANVVLATGTAGGDAVITKAIPAPRPLHGWRYMRAVARIAGNTGAAVDTYSIAYRYLAQ